MKMAVLAIVARLARTVQNSTMCLAKASLASKFSNKVILPCDLSSMCFIGLRVGIHMSAMQNDLMEFFDDEKNWSEYRVKVGRSWRMDELRIRSNEDLHKLWYILLKEKNMLLSMAHASREKYEYFPNPERIDKVEESMENLETVIRERNRAYHHLETGEHGERPTRIVHNQIGLTFRYKMREHLIPKFMNEEWRKNNKHYYGGYAVSKFLRLYREKLFLQNKRMRNRQQHRVQMLLRRFPTMDIEALKSKFPDINIERVKTFSYSKGHHIPE